ncbi:hypothetical protein LFX25_07145 [Leptospira sp. FAT2]|uniref:hypothetical protein n=1 Tax=Leptospira sanjuanensis TaxID=2879643 RepID=UPI001EE9036F|nr:hypothetical protein [Leptospira sanjuanensis]MCG6167597.1 hypothetical protein [Leptospira sanjuanensis]MCG6193016.1 hypothetical protein [Leptospira sanjuanensis]
MKFIVLLEKKFPVEQWEMSGFYIWPVIRLGFLTYLDDISKAYHNTNLLRNLLWVMKDFFLYFFSVLMDMRKNSSIKERTDIVFLTSSTTRIKTPDGHFYDRLMDPYLETLTRKNLPIHTFEIGYRGDYRIPRKYSSEFLSPFFNILAFASMFFGRKKIEDKIKTFPKFEEFVRFIEEQNLDINRDSILQLMKRVNLIRSWATHFKKKLVKIQPKLGFLMACYGPMGMAYILACHECNVLTVDIQHGVAGDFHPGYGRWTKFPKSQKYELLPDYFWSWDQEDADSIKKWNKFTEHKSILGGNFFLEIFKANSSDIVYQYEKLFLKIVSAQKKNILVTLQPHSGLTPVTRALMKESAEDWFWWIRLHPDMKNLHAEISKDVSSIIKNGNWDVENASTLPLYTILRFADIHITDSSAVVKEAAKFDVPSIIENKWGKDHFRTEIKLGIAKQLSDISKIQSIFNNTLYKGKRLKIDKNKFLSRAEKALDKLLQKANLSLLI